MFSLQRVAEFFRAFDFRATTKWLMLSVLVGIVAGLGAILFQFLQQLTVHYTLEQFAGFVPLEAGGEHSVFVHQAGTFSPWLIVAVMTGGGIVSGWLVYTFAPEAEGHGTDAAIDAFHNKRGFVRGRIPFIKTVASAITLGTGGSGGREGPIAQIGAGFGSYLATKLQLPVRDRRVLLAAGMGAGVGAIFRAPLGGALFASEILYRDADMESDVLVPAAISSIVGYSVFTFSQPEGHRFEPLFTLPVRFQAVSPLELLPMAGLAVVLVLAGILYIKVFYGTHALFKRLPGVPHVRPALGAALAGVFTIGLFFVLHQDQRVLAALATGYGGLQQALDPSNAIGIHILLAIALAKIVTTSLTIGSGGSGGVFGPSVVIGGCLGAAVGQYFHRLWPELITQPQAYAIIGMAGFFAGCARAPLTTILMIAEMTGGYSLLLPTMWVCTLCFLLCRRWTLYHQQVPSRLESPAHRGDFIVDLLEGMKVADVPFHDGRVIKIAESTSLDDIVHRLAKTQQHYFPVVNGEGQMVGIFSSDDVRSYLYDETIWQLAVARDIMVTNVVSVTPKDDLNTALQRFTMLNLDELPVVDPDNSGKLLGMLRRKETIAVYNRRLMEHKQASAE